jgi:outer membrane receptor protein involved in Fe transport
MTLNPRLAPLRIALTGSIFLAGACLPALAQRPDASPRDLATMTLEELLRIKVTTASKKSESLFDAPAIMIVLTDRDIQSYGSPSLIEVLDRTTSVFVLGTQENLQGALTMRGDATLGANNHILLLLNGRPIQESTYGGTIHPFLRSFPLASIKQIEIVRGPGSVLYGTNAYVGVINIITKDWDADGVASVSYGAFHTKTVSAAGGKTMRGLQVSAGIALSHDDGWDFTATDSLDSGKLAITRTVPWFDRKVGANLNARYKGLNLDVFYAKTQSPHLSNSSATTSWARYGVSNTDQAMVDLGYEHRVSARWTSSLHGTYNHFREQADFGEVGTRDILSTNYVVEWVNNLSVGNTVNTVFGANLAKRTGSFYEAAYQWYGVPHYNRNNATVFAQVDYRPISRLKLIAGGQLIKIPGFDTHVTGGQSGQVSRISGLPPHFAGRLGAVVTLTENLGVKLLYSQAFREPSVVETDLVRYRGGEYSQEGNPDLKPETIGTTDVQIRYGNDRLNAAVTVFNSRQSNVIVETDAFDLIQNFDRFHTHGIEGETLIRPMRNVELTAAVTYQTLNNQTDRVFSDIAIPVPRFMGKVGISYRTASGLTLDLHDSYFGTPKESSHVDAEDPANTTQHVNPTASAFHNVTANLAYRLRKFAFLRPGTDVTAHLYGNNLLGAPIYYAEYTSVNVNSIPGRPGRAVFAGVSFGF